MVTNKGEAMKSRSLLFTPILILAMLACNLPSTLPTESPTVTAITPSVTQPPSATVAPTQTALPSNTPPPTTTSTPSVPVAFPRDVAVNCRLGPGTGWIVLSGLSLGASSQITGKSADGGWWQIIDPLNSARRCWVASGVTNTAGNVTNIPVAESPKASVTDVNVNVDPRSFSVAGCIGPIASIKLSGTIETDGPTTVQWRFETQQSGALTTQTTQFDAFGETSVSADYTPTLTAGTYWVRLIITAPNNVQDEVNYTITCP
jgi:hypothetical protein